MDGDYLNFEKFDIIQTKRYHLWKRQPPNIGFIKKRSNLKKKFLRSSMRRIYSVSNEYMSFFD